MNNFSIHNAESLNSYAQNTVRHLRNYDNKRAFENFTKLLEEGVNAPGYTRMVLNNAKFDNAKFLSNLVEDGSLDISSAHKRNGDTILGIANLWKTIRNSELDINFKKSYAQFYPKSAQYRIAIETFLTEGTKEFVSCSHNKLYKKLLFFFLKRC